MKFGFKTGIVEDEPRDIIQFNTAKDGVYVDINGCYIAKFFEDGNIELMDGDRCGYKLIPQKVETYGCGYVHKYKLEPYRS